MDIAKMDDALPTLVRYTGLVLTVILIGFSLAGYYVQAAPGFLAAAGMLVYKTMKNAAKEE